MGKYTHMKNIKIIKINIITYLYILLIIFSGYYKYLLYFSLVFIVHELGHIFFCKLFRVKILKIDIYPFGGIIKLNKKLNINIYKDFFIASGGIFFQLILEIINTLFFKNPLLLNTNKIIFLINIVPLIPLDGSKIFFIIISKFFSFYKSVKIYYLFNIFFIMIYFITCSKMSNINYTYIFFCIASFFIEIFNYKSLINKFYLERYIYDFKYKKRKYHKKKTLKLLKREVESYFYDETWFSEKKLLRKKFDNSSYFW
jgi:stage IV sporulation protein FB